MGRPRKYSHPILFPVRSGAGLIYERIVNYDPDWSKPGRARTEPLPPTGRDARIARLMEFGMTREAAEACIAREDGL